MAQAQTTQAGTEAHGGDHAEVGFPPFETETFGGQLFWLIVTFAALYTLMSKLVLPRPAGILEGRRQAIARDLDEAAAMKTRAEAGAAYEKSLAEARARPRPSRHRTRAKLGAESEAKRKALEADLRPPRPGRSGNCGHQEPGHVERPRDRARDHRRHRRAPHGAGSLAAGRGCGPRPELKDTVMLASAEFWVGVAFVIFWGILFYYGVPQRVLSLDSRGRRVADELAEANRLRMEAEALLREFETKRAAAEREAAEIVSNARDEAERLARETQEKMADFVKRRTATAETKIAQAEAQAAAEVRAAAVDAAVRASERVAGRALRSGRRGARGEEPQRRADEAELVRRSASGSRIDGRPRASVSSRIRM